MPKEDDLVQIESRHIGGTRVVDVSIPFPSCSQPASIVRNLQYEGSSETYPLWSQGAAPPPPLHVATSGKNHLNEEITPLLPTGIDKRYCQTLSNLGLN